MGKIRVTKDSEVLEIEPSDLKNAMADGYRQVQTIPVTNGKEVLYIDDTDLENAIKDGYVKKKDDSNVTAKPSGNGLSNTQTPNVNLFGVNNAKQETVLTPDFKPVNKKQEVVKKKTYEAETSPTKEGYIITPIVKEPQTYKAAITTDNAQGYITQILKSKQAADKLTPNKPDIFNQGGGDNVNDYTLESIEKHVDKKNPIEARAFELYKKERNLNDAQNNAANVDEMAINFMVAQNPLLKSQKQKLESGGETLPNAMQGQLVSQFLNDDDVIKRANSDLEFRKQYLQTANNLYTNYPEYAKTAVGNIISQEMEDEGSYNKIARTPTKEETDKFVDKLVSEGKLSEKQKAVYDRTIAPELGIGKSILRGVGHIIAPAFTDDSPIKTTDLASTFGESWDNSMGSIYKSLKGMVTPELAYTKLLNGGTEAQDLQEALKKEAETIAVTPKNIGSKISSSTGNLLGLVVPMMATGGVLGKTGMVAAEEINMALQFAGHNRETAIKNFPESPLKQTMYTAASTAIDMYLGKLLPHNKAGAEAISKSLSKDISGVIKDFADEKISAAVAKKTIQDKFVSVVKEKIPEVLKANTKTGAIMAGFTAAHNELDAVFGAKPPQSANEKAKELYGAFESGFLGNTLIALAMGGKGTKYVGENLVKAATSPEQYIEKIKSEAANNPEIFKQQEQLIENIKIASEAKQVADQQKLKPEQTEKFVLLHVAQRIEENKATNATVDVVKDEATTKAKELKLLKEKIYKGEDIPIVPEQKEEQPIEIPEAPKVEGEPEKITEAVELSVEPKEQLPTVSSEGQVTLDNYEVNDVVIPEGIEKEINWQEKLVDKAFLDMGLKPNKKTAGTGTIYYTFKDKNGEDITIRLGDHSKGRWAGREVDGNAVYDKKSSPQDVLDILRDALPDGKIIKEKVSSEEVKGSGVVEGSVGVGGDVEQTLLDNYSNKGRDESSKKVVQEDGTVLDRLDGVVYSVTEPTKGADGKVDKNLRQIIPTNDKSLDGQPLWKDMSNTSEVPDIRVVTKENAPPKPKPSDFSGLPEKERYKAYSEAVEKWENDYTEKKQVGTKKQTTQIQSPLFDYDPEYKGQTKEEIGYKKIKSKAVEQSLKETTKAGSVGVEAKKADIERRRQEELKQPIKDKLQEIEKAVKTLNITTDKDGKLEQTSDEIITNIKSELDKIGLPYKGVASNENGSSYKVITNDGTEIEVVKLLKSGGALIKPTLSTAKFINHLIKTEPQTLRDLISNQINAKYDAELKALENKPTPSLPSNVSSEEEGSVGVGGDVAVDNPVLKDVESTKSALEESMSNGQMGKILNKEGVKEIPVSDIVENPNDKSFEDAIRKVKQGLGSRTKEPIIVVLKNDGKYHIRDGTHRVAEAMVKGDKNISADVEYDVEFNQSKNLSEAYHEAKKNGTNPELVERVEKELEKYKTNVNAETKAQEPITETDAGVKKGNEPITPKETEPTKEGNGEDTPPPTEGEQVGVFAEGKRTVFSHRGLQEVATEFGLDDITSREKVSDLELFRRADETINKWAEEGSYKKNVDDLIAKAEKGDIFSPEQNVIMAQHIAQLRENAAKIRKSKGIDSKEYNDALKELQHLTTVGQKVRSDIGAALRVPTIARTPLSSLEDAMTAKMEANGTDVLTDIQKKEVEAQFKDYEEKLNNANAKWQEAENKNAELEAENALLKIQKEKPKTTEKRDYKKDRESLKEKLKDEFSKYQASGQKMGIASDGGLESFKISVKMAKLVTEIAKTHVDEVGAKLAEVTKKVLDDIKSIIPDITERDIHDIIRGEYNEKRPTQTQLQIDWRDLQTETKLLQDYERLLNAEPKNEKQKRAKNERLTELRKQIASLKKEEKEGNTFSKEEINDEVKKAQSLIKRNIEQSKKIKERIANKDFEPKEKPKSFIGNQEFKKKYPKVYNDALDSVIKKEEAQLEFDKALIADEYAKSSKMDKLKDIAKKTSGTIKNLFASFDFSALTIQNLPAIMTNPVIGAKSIPKSFRDFASQKKFDRYLAELHNNSEAWDLIQAGKLKVSEPKSLLEEGREQLFPDRFKAIVKIKGKTYGYVKLGEGKYELFDISKPFERAFTSLGNHLRTIKYLTEAQKLLDKGYTIEKNKEEFETLGRRINNLTSSPDIPLAYQNAVTNTLIWSTKLMAVKLNMLGISDVASAIPGLGIKKGYYRSLGVKGQVLSRQQLHAVGDLAKFASAVMATTYLSAMIGGGQVNLDPFDDKFLDVKFKDGTSKNYTGGFSKYISLVFQLIRQGESKNGKFAKWKGLKDRGQQTMHFLAGKAPPITRAAESIIIGKDYMGKESNLGTEASKLKYPMAVGQIAEQIKKYGMEGLFEQGIEILIGIGVRDERDYPFKTEIKNYKDGGREITKEENKEFEDKRDAEVENELQLLKDGKSEENIFSDGSGGTVTKKLEDMTPDEKKNAETVLKSKATRKIKAELFGEKEETIEDLINKSAVDIEKERIK